MSRSDRRPTFNPDFISYSDTPDDVQVRHLRQEVSRVASEANWYSGRALRRTRIWNATYIMLGLPAAVLAGISGATGLASVEGRIPAAFLALVAAGLVAAAGFLQSESRAVANDRCKSAWRVLEDHARLVAARQGYGDRTELHAALERLYEQRKAIIRGDFDEVIGISSQATQYTIVGQPRSIGVERSSIIVGSDGDQPER
ncbi:hypothetical protein ACSDR0_07985 [Streptosporangium sp. G11]|uniref:hypothetical protein n=1 Tax=Streptosporangium sp. G11 TaxID=3436926 RepID=UPI003EC0CF83